jgi:hypothetical protein
MPARDYGEAVDPQRLIGLFETEVFSPKGERIGPVVIWDSKERRERGETEWMTEAAARSLARQRGWRFRVDLAEIESWQRQ